MMGNVIIGIGIAAGLMAGMLGYAIWRDAHEPAPTGPALKRAYLRRPWRRTGP